MRKVAALAPRHVHVDDDGRRVAFATLAYPPTTGDEQAGRQGGRPNPAQAQFHRLANTHKMYVGGFGAGKTSAGVYESFLLALHNPGSLNLCVAPTWRHVTNMMDGFSMFLRCIEMRDGVRLYKSFRRSQNANPGITWLNGTVTSFVSGWNPEQILAPSVASVWIDELEWMRDGAGGQTVLQNVITRIRQRSQLGVRTIRRRSLLVTTTARSLTGAVKAIYQAAQRKDHEDGVEPWGVVVAPSHVAIGYGLERHHILQWRSEMSRQDFRRMVECELGSPPGIVYADSVSQETWPDGNLIDWPELRPEFPTFFAVDWGTWRPHVLVLQHDKSQDLDIVVAEWGLDNHDVHATVEWMVRFAREHEFNPANVFMDPTDNPGTKTAHGLAIQGRLLLRQQNWRVSWPHGYQRSIDMGVAVVRARLCLGNDKRRIVFARHLTSKKPHKLRMTDRGIWDAVTEGYRYKTNPITGEVMEQIHHDPVYSHAADALRYFAVCGHPYEHLKIGEWIAGDWGPGQTAS